MVRPDEVKPETWAIIAGRPSRSRAPPSTPPVVAASTYVLGSERIYSRNEATEGWESFEAMLGGLEGGEAVAFSSGMAACAAVSASFGRRAPGARRRLLPGRGRDRRRRRTGPSVARRAAAGHRSTVAQRASEADLLGWSRRRTRCSTSPTSPRSARRPRTRTASSSTTPSRRRCFSAAGAGADIVVHSATKLIGGHSDLLLGAAVTADAEELPQLRAARQPMGPLGECSNACLRCVARVRWPCGCATLRPRRTD